MDFVFAFSVTRQSFNLVSFGFIRLTSERFQFSLVTAVHVCFLGRLRVSGFRFGNELVFLGLRSLWSAPQTAYLLLTYTAAHDAIQGG